jgi:hypothetical protein
MNQALSYAGVILSWARSFLAWWVTCCNGLETTDHAAVASIKYYQFLQSATLSQQPSLIAAPPS